MEVSRMGEAASGAQVSRRFTFRKDAPPPAADFFFCLLRVMMGHRVSFSFFSLSFRERMQPPAIGSVDAGGLRKNDDGSAFFAHAGKWLDDFNRFISTSDNSSVWIFFFRSFR